MPQSVRVSASTCLACGSRRCSLEAKGAPTAVLSVKALDTVYLTGANESCASGWVPTLFGSWSSSWGPKSGAGGRGASKAVAAVPVAVTGASAKLCYGPVGSDGRFVETMTHETWPAGSSGGGKNETTPAGSGSYYSDAAVYMLTMGVASSSMPAGCSDVYGIVPAWAQACSGSNGGYGGSGGSGSLTIVGRNLSPVTRAKLVLSGQTCSSSGAERRASV